MINKKLLVIFLIVFIIVLCSGCAPIYHLTDNNILNMNNRQYVLLDDQNWVTMQERDRIGFLEDYSTSIYGVEGDSTNNVLVVKEWLSDAQHVPFIAKDLNIQRPNVNNIIEIEWIEGGKEYKRIDNKKIIEDFFEIYNNISIELEAPYGIQNEYIYLYTRIEGLAYKLDIVTFKNKYWLLLENGKAGELTTSFIQELKQDKGTVHTSG